MKKKEKPFLVFLPGKICDQRLWSKQIDALSEIITPIFVDLTKYTTLDEMLTAVVLNTPKKFALAGFSMGGYVALEFILKYPERVQKLALVGSSAQGYDDSMRKYYKNAADLIKRFGFQGLSQNGVKQLIDPSRYSDQSLCNVIVNMTQELGADVFYNQQMATLNRIDRRGELHQIHCPTLVVGGDSDQIVKKDEFMDLANGIKGAQLKILNQCGHMVPLERSEELIHLMQTWLESTSDLA